MNTSHPLRQCAGNSRYCAGKSWGIRERIGAFQCAIAPFPIGGALEIGGLLASSDEPSSAVSHTQYAVRCVAQIKMGEIAADDRITRISAKYGT